MQTLYPVIKPYAVHELTVDEIHHLYVEEVGNPEGVPVIVLHAGPGAGGAIHFRRYFDPEYYRIIIFDQRGSGRSTPHAEIRNNTTSFLIADIEAVREYFNLPQVILFGGGWGCLLALLYAQKHPEQVSGLLLQRILLGRQKDIDWFYRSGANLIYPEHWQTFINGIPPSMLDEIPAYYVEQLHSENEIARMAAAKNFSAWQAHCASIQPHQALLDQYADPHFALSLATIETYYLIHHYFIEENQVLRDAHLIQHIPAYLIHGRYDMITPFAGAWDLHQALPQSQLSIVRDAGHFDQDAGMIDALIGASKALIHYDLNLS